MCHIIWQYFLSSWSAFFHGTPFACNACVHWRRGGGGSTQTNIVHLEKKKHAGNFLPPLSEVSLLIKNKVNDNWKIQIFTYHDVFFKAVHSGWKLQAVLNCLRTLFVEEGVFTFSFLCADEDVNECKNDTVASSCPVGAFCKDTPDSFRCQCKRGYTGNGSSCTSKLTFLWLLFFV